MLVLPVRLKTPVFLLANEFDFRFSKCIARASELGSCQSNLCISGGYERLRNSIDSLKTCFNDVICF